LTINEPFTATSTTLTISFTITGGNGITGTDTGKEDTIKLVLPNYWLDSTTTTTTANCGGATFTVAATGGDGATATSDLTFTAATADVAAGTACTITTHISQARTSAAAVPANSETITLQFIDGADTPSDSISAAAIPSSTAVTAPAFSDTELSFPNTMQATTTAFQALTFKFKCTASVSKEQTAQKVVLALPGWDLSTDAGTTTTLTGCGTDVTFTVSIDNTNKLATFTVGGASVAKDTACTIVTLAIAKTPTAHNAANDASYTVLRQTGATANPAAAAIATSPALTSPLGSTRLDLLYPVIGTNTAATFTFTPAVVIEAGKTITLTMPYFTFTAGVVTGSAGCAMATADAALSGTNSGADSALVMTIGGTNLAASTACTITIPSTMMKQVATTTQALSVAQAQNLDTRLVALENTAAIAAGTSTPITHSTPTVAAAALSNLALVVATTTGSTATSLSLTFDSNIPLAIGDYVMMTLPDWGVSGTTAPTAVGCGTSTFTTVTGMSGTATAYVQFSVATALLDTVTYLSEGHSMGHNCTLTWASGATTPAAAQAANLNTRKLSAVIAAGADITNTSITTSTATTAAPAPAPAGNGTGTGGGTTSGTFSTATTTITFSGYTYAAGAAANINFGNVVGCAYAKTVSDATTSLTSDMCTASAGPTFTYLTGSSTTNTVSAARRTGSSVAVALKVYHSLLSQTAAEAAVTQVGTTLATINAAVAAINAAAGTNFSTAQLTASGMTAATWTHSSASVVVPSITAMFSALLLVLMQ